jgi:hypothetical protein
MKELNNCLKLSESPKCVELSTPLIKQKLKRLDLVNSILKNDESKF